MEGPTDSFNYQYIMNCQSTAGILSPVPDAASQMPGVLVQSRRDETTSRQNFDDHQARRIAYGVQKLRGRGQSRVVQRPGEEWVELAEAL